jgi:hypothetical protein
MPLYVCKHYRRFAPGAETGTVLNEIRFEADSAARAETRMRQSFRSPIMRPWTGARTSPPWKMKMGRFW